MPWRSESHITVTLFCDASKRAWGGVLLTDGGRIEARDYWRDETGSINLLEAKALLCALDAFKSRIRNSRVDVHTDSRVLLGSWQNESGNNSEINDVNKAILRCSQDFNFLISMHYVPSAENPADLPSRRFSDLDCTLSEEAWSRVQRCSVRIPLISCHLTATAAVIGLVIVCRILRHATPQSRPVSTCLHNSCLPGETFLFSPPLILIGPLLRFFIDSHYQCPFTIIVPDIQPRRYWWAF